MLLLYRVVGRVDLGGSQARIMAGGLLVVGLGLVLVGFLFLG